MISVIVPVYKVEPYLRQCIDSILNQTYRDIEVLLIDDGSPDRCGEICEEYARADGRVKVVHIKHTGLGEARNLGLREAAGEYIGFVDSDDWIEPDMFEVLMNSMQKTGADICVCGLWYESVTSSEEECTTEAFYHGKASQEALLDRKINNFMWNKLFRRRLFDTVSFPENSWFEDSATMHLLLSRAETVAVAAVPKYHYRQRAESITNSIAAKELFDFADAYLGRCRYFRDEEPEIFARKRETVLRLAAEGISRLWLFWYGCSREEKQAYQERIKELRQFSKEHFPLTGCRSWSVYLRVATVFMHSDSKVSFAVLYLLNQAAKKIWVIRKRIRLYA